MTDTNIVERVARAIHEVRSDIPWSATAQQDLAYRDARAAIAAMREPSEHAMDCGAYRLPGIMQEAKRAKARDVYRAMIDAALETPAGKEE